MRSSKKTIFSFLGTHLATAIAVMWLAPSRAVFALQNPLQATNLVCFLSQLLDAIILIVFPFLVLALVYAGFKFVQARGNPTKLEDARRAIVWVLVGALIVLGAKAISLAIVNTVNSIAPTSVTVPATC